MLRISLANFGTLALIDNAVEREKWQIQNTKKNVEGYPLLQMIKDTTLVHIYEMIEVEVSGNMVVR